MIENDAQFVPYVSPANKHFCEQAYKWISILGHAWTLIISLTVLVTLNGCIVITQNIVFFLLE